VTLENLAQIERGEAVLRELGFRQFRLRHHDALARIEIAQDELPRAIEAKVAAEIISRVQQVGYAQVMIDPEGYRQGSLNVLAGITVAPGHGRLRSDAKTSALSTEPSTSNLRIL
jgi:uncharacterized protein